MIIAIRIKGQVGIPRSVKETLFRMRLRRKYSAVLLKPTNDNLKLLKSMRNHIAYGDIDEETHKELIEKRGKGKKLFFRLHPPRGGIDSKKHFGVGKGVLGDNKKKINDLVRRML